MEIKQLQISMNTQIHAPHMLIFCMVGNKSKYVCVGGEENEIDFRRKSRVFEVSGEFFLEIFGILGKIYKREQVQTLSSVSGNDLGRLSPCSLNFYRLQTLKPDVDRFICGCLSLIIQGKDSKEGGKV